MLTLLCLCVHCKPVPAARKYTIGGWTSDPESSFLSKWEPIFGTYLSNAVGSLYDPPITFELIAADYSPEASFDALIAAGAIDFVCEGSSISLFCLFQFI
jgi:hypothetical protein